MFSNWSREDVVEIEQGEEWIYTLETPYDRSITVEAGLLYGRNFVNQDDEPNRHHIIVAPKYTEEGIYQLRVVIRNAVSEETFLRTIVVLKVERYIESDEQNSSTKLPSAIEE